MIKLLTLKAISPYAEDTVYKICVSHTGELAFRTEGDKNAALQRSSHILKAAFRAAAPGIRLKLPGSVEVQPAFPAKLRTGMFGSWDWHMVFLRF